MNESTSNADELIEIFNEAQSLPPGEQRRQFLAEACGDDEQLRAEVSLLLQANSRAGDFLEAATLKLDAGLQTEGPGDVIGRYKLLERIGEGGFGVVYMAEQQQPVRRKVALKILKPGMDSRQVLARFEAERQALAIMDHPNIATVFDGGATASGRPYFVMELVKGVPITEFCDQHQFTPRARLELFAQVCHAVQHAHQKGIIHRDIKPSNILVAMHDATPAVKVIDFGVAKALGQELTEKTLFTGFAQLIGTPLYMSPEQAGQSFVDVDTRSDIYSLGVLLYELLTGTTPFDRERFTKAAQDEIRRIVLEEEPPKPSTRLSESKDSLPSISAQRHTAPAKLTKLVRGELDWIVMKALEKERARRYETASGFAMDVQRYLAGEPVVACPPSSGYRLKKFVRRNKGPVTAGAVVLLTLVGGIAGTSFGLVRAEEARRAAAERAEGERRAKLDAETRETETRAVLDFVEKRIFVAARPFGDEGGLGLDVTLRTAIEAALPFVAREFAAQPLIDARLRLTLAESFRCLGDAKTAARLGEAARALLVEHRGPGHTATLQSMQFLALSYIDLGRHEEALKLGEETLAIAEASLGPNHQITVDTMAALAVSYANAGRPADALRLDEKVLTLNKARHGSHHRAVLMNMQNLAGSYEALGRFTDALKLREQTLELQETNLGPDDADTLDGINNLAASYRTAGRNADALKLHRETLTLLRARLGVGHIKTIASMSNLAVTCDDLGRNAEALTLHEEALALAKAHIGPDHPQTLGIMTNLARCYLALQRKEDARKLDEQTLELKKSRLGPTHPDTLASLNNLAGDCLALGRLADALRLREEVRELMTSKQGPDHPDTLWSMHNLATTYAELGRREKAFKLRAETLALANARFGPDYPLTLWCRNNMGLSYADDGRLTEACDMIEETVERAKKMLGPHHLETLKFMGNLVIQYEALGRNEDARKLREEIVLLKREPPGLTQKDSPAPSTPATSVPAPPAPPGPVMSNIKSLEEILDSVRKTKGPEAAETITAMTELASAWGADGSARKAIKLGEEALRLARRVLPAGDPRTIAAMKVLVPVYRSVDLNDEAQKLESEIKSFNSER